MTVGIRSWILSVALLVCSGSISADDTKSKSTDTKATSTDTPATKQAPPTVEEIDFPPDAIIVLCEQAAKILSLVPKAVLLSPERFQELRRLEEEKMQRRQAEDSRPMAPAMCVLHGAVDADLAQITAQFKFTTPRPRMLVTLGCQRSWVRAASINGRLPAFVTESPRDDGLTIAVESAGQHQATITMAIPVATRATRSGERNFDLGLPRCTITQLERLRFAGPVSDIRVNGRAVTAQATDASTRTIDDLVLGAANHLDVVWRIPAPATEKGRELVAAEGKIHVRMEEKRMVTDVDLNLTVLRGEVSTWRILLPKDVVPEIREPASQDERIERRDLPTTAEPWLTIRMKRPSAAPLRLALQLVQPRADAPIAVGPVLVLGALRQHGTIAVTAPPDNRLTITPGVDAVQRENSDDAVNSSPDAAFAYWHSASTAVDAQSAPPLLTISARAVQGAVESRFEHGIQVGENGWHLQSKFEFTPLRTSIDSVELQLPAEFLWDRTAGVSPAELVDDLQFDPRTRVVRVKLNQKHSRPFSLGISSVQQAAPASEELAAPAPTVLHCRDRGGVVVASVPEGMEVARLDSPSAGNGRRASWRLDRSPEQVVCRVRRFRPELTVQSLLDIQLIGARAVVRQQLAIQSAPALPRMIRLQIPNAVADSFRVTSGGMASAEGIVKLDSSATSAQVTTEYTCNLAAPADKTAAQTETSSGSSDAGPIWNVPIVRIAQATRGETKVRIWCDEPRTLQPTSPSWQESSTEIAPDKAVLPAIVLRSNQHDLPLTLIARPADSVESAMIIDQAAIQVVAAIDGELYWRAQFRVARFLRRRLEVDFRSSVLAANLEVLIDGKRSVRWSLRDDGGNTAARGRFLGLDIEPDLYANHVPIEIGWKAELPQREVANVQRLSLQAPRIASALLAGPIRWQVRVPHHSLVVPAGSFVHTDVVWSWHGGMLAPQPQTEAGDADFAQRESAIYRDGTLPTNDYETQFVGWQSEGGFIDVYVVSRLAWLLTCSFVVLVAGLIISVYAPTRRGMLFAGVIGCALVVIGVWRPDFLAYLFYGSEPGLAVLLAVLSIHWISVWSRKRRRHHLPGFMRVATGGPAGSTGSGAKRRAEPSTVDAPEKKDIAPTAQASVQEL